MSIHDGHRDRIRKRFLENGLDSFTDIQVLEFLLFYTNPRKDTNPIAHALLSHFGSLSQVLDAPVEELMKVDGIGERSAVLLRLVRETGRFYQVDKSMQMTILNTIDQCGSYLISYFFGRNVESVYLLCLDAKCKVLCCKEVGQGSVNSAGLSIRRVVETALAANATSVVLAHNHPSGIALPSHEDILTSQKVARALSTVDIAFVDHIIVADDDFVSLVQSGCKFDDCVIY